MIHLTLDMAGLTQAGPEGGMRTFLGADMTSPLWEMLSSVRSWYWRTKISKFWWRAVERWRLSHEQRTG